MDENQEKAWISKELALTAFFVILCSTIGGAITWEHSRIGELEGKNEGVRPRRETFQGQMAGFGVT